ncbi:MAG: adenosylcobinamide-GDP ribazoletransferase [Lentisphaerae bacterium]|nr:adenosylcobinamide-GDP ribazoletransferase [Lentisphaerota bacterium]
MLGGLITAVRTLTILPMPGKDAPRLADALHFFSLVGALIGALVTLAVWFFGAVVLWPMGAGIVGVVMSSLVTRGLHLDGLSDTVDAYFGSTERERRLEIMKDHHAGAFGVTAITLVLLIKTAALAQLAVLGQWAAIPVPFILARLTQVLLAVMLPYARAEGGTAEELVKQAAPVHFISTGILALILCGLLIKSCAPLLLLVALLLGPLLGRWMKRAFGGVTGDLLGFANEIVECVLLLTLAAALPYWQNICSGFME